MSGVGFLLARLRIREVGFRLIKLNVVAARPAATRSILQSNALRLAGTRSVTTKSTKSTSSRKTTAAKKAPAKKAPAKKSAAKKPAAKKTTAKAKKPVAKKAAKKKSSKAMSSEEKEKKKERVATEKLKLKKAELRALALEPPSDKPTLNVNGYSMYLAEGIKGKKGGLEALKNFQSTNDWKNLPDAEKQKYSNLAKERKEQIFKAYQAFVESHTPAAIREANSARKQLEKLIPSRKWPLIVDHRKPKLPRQAYVYFYKELHGSPDLAHLGPIKERAKEIGEKWKALPEAEKRPYYQLAEADKTRYFQEKARLG